VLNDVDRGPIVLDRMSATIAGQRIATDHLAQQVAVRQPHDVLAAAAFEAHGGVQTYVVHYEPPSSNCDADGQPSRPETRVIPDSTDRVGKPGQPHFVQCAATLVSIGSDSGCARRYGTAAPP